MRPNPVCTSADCLKRQAEHKGWVAPEDQPESSAAKKEAVVHESNEWGITLEGSSADAEDSEATKAVNKGGLSFEYDAAAASAAAPASAPAAAPAAAAAAPAAAVPEVDLSDLFAQLKSAQK